MTFASPLLLLALLVVPLAAAGYWWLQSRPPRYTVEFPNLELLALVSTGVRPWRRHVPAALLLAALTALVLGLARPQVTVSVPRENATIVLAVDSSGSMMARDVRPTRMSAAQSAVRTFLDEIPDKFRVGLVTFAGEAQVVAPVSRDRELVRSALDYLFPLRGTAIGDAVVRSAELAQQAVGGQRRGRVVATLASVTTPLAATTSDKPPAAVLFLSDGFQTEGRLTPEEGAARAKELGVPVYTIALGTAEGYVEFDFGGGDRRIPVPPDRETLRRIAETTGGEYFDAPTAEALTKAYEELGSRLGREPGEEEATFALLAIAAVLLLAATALGALTSARLP